MHLLIRNKNARCTFSHYVAVVAALVVVVLAVAIFIFHVHFNLHPPSPVNLPAPYRTVA